MSTIQEGDQPQKLPLAVIGSVGVNVLLWFALGQGSNMPVPVINPPELVFDRVVVDKKDPSAKPVFHSIKVKPLPPPEKKVERKPVSIKQPPPESAHNHVMASKAPSPSPSRDDFVVHSGGNAKLGVPIDKQGNGNAVENPVTPPPTAPPVDTTKPVVNTPPPAAPPVETKKEAPVIPPPPPPPPSPPVKPKGESREAKPDHQESVEIPESLKSQTFKSFVRVRVEIGADGKFKVILRTSSGNTDIDKLVLDTLNKWTWKPALKDGDSVDSVQQFRFNFTIE
jgi:TonB family protein